MLGTQWPRHLGTMPLSKPGLVEAATWPWVKGGGGSSCPALDATFHSATGPIQSSRPAHRPTGECLTSQRSTAQISQASDLLRSEGGWRGKPPAGPFLGQRVSQR